jgi:hypothetical protein
MRDRLGGVGVAGGDLSYDLADWARCGRTESAISIKTSVRCRSLGAI